MAGQLTSLIHHHEAKAAHHFRPLSSVQFDVALRAQRPHGLLGTGSPGRPHSSGAV